jgi:type 1 glutamine amidotransferase
MGMTTLTGRALIAAGAAAALFFVAAHAQQGPAAGQAPAGGRGGNNLGTQLFAAFDANKDGSVTRDEMQAAFGAWYAAADSGKTGSATQAQLAMALGAAFPAPEAPAPAGGGGGGRGGGGRGAQPFVAGATTPGLNDPCGGRSQKPAEPCAADVEKMLAALPAGAPAKPAKARKVLIFSRIPSAGYQHSSIPLAARTIEEMGKKTGAWTSDTSWDPAVFTTENLKQYDAVFLSSTTGCFLDQPGDRAATDARRAAFVEFVRGGKGVAGIHATGDSYHSPCPNDDPAAAGARGGFGRGGAAGIGGSLAAAIVRWSWGLNEKKLQANDVTMTAADMDAVGNGWYDQLDAEKTGKVTQASFLARIVPVATIDNKYVGAPGRDNGRGSWPDWDNMIGGWFKFHWLDPQKITVKIDDRTSPLTKMFGGREFDVNDETYTFSVSSFSRDHVHVLTSIDYGKMSFMDRLKESNPRPDHDFALSWIHRDGQGRLFYMALGHNERIYAMKPMMEHLLAGMQYALGDLKADDAPGKK